MNMEIVAPNVNMALSEALRYLKVSGVQEGSRNGGVVAAPGFVCTTYLRPQERVLFSPRRDANPFFHLMEALWMLAGRNDLAWPAQFAKQIANYSDDGVTLNGAYGYRWRKHFGYDQLRYIVKELEARPNSRRAVLAMWDPREELTYACEGGKDACCNTQVYFDRRNDRLNMTVLCRSNDALWGAYGANAVHFSVLQEYLAHWLGSPVGLYRQLSHNFHVYTNVLPLEEFDAAALDAETHDYYGDERTHRNLGVLPSPLINTCAEDWDNDLHCFLDDPTGERTTFVDKFFTTVAVPMYRAWSVRKLKGGSGIHEASRIAAADWRRACMEWIARREGRKAAAVSA
jgi:hypothetical protein